MRARKSFPASIAKVFSPRRGAGVSFLNQESPLLLYRSAYPGTCWGAFSSLRGLIPWSGHCILIRFILKGIIIHLWEIQKFRHGHVESNCNLMKCHDSWVKGFELHQIFKSRMADAAHFRQLVQVDISLFAEEADTVHNNSRIYSVRTPHPLLCFLILPIYGHNIFIVTVKKLLVGRIQPTRSLISKKGTNIKWCSHLNN